VQIQPLSTTSTDLTSVSDPEGLTADEMFTYCEAQMNSIDASVSGYVQTQDNNLGVKQSLGQIMDDLRSWQSQMGGSPSQTNADEVNKIQAELTSLQAQYPAGASAIQDVIQTLTTDGKGGTDDVVSSTDIDNMLSSLSDIANGIDSNNQMAMIQLQSAMSQREQVIELTTNILQTLNDSQTKVITNIHS
jgi:hypothetical protein